jgi:copper chaperone CopZ
MQTVDLKLRMCCEGCERVVRAALQNLRGVDSVEVDVPMEKVTVTGYVDRGRLLREVRRSGKRPSSGPAAVRRCGSPRRGATSATPRGRTATATTTAGTGTPTATGRGACASPPAATTLLGTSSTMTTSTPPAGSCDSRPSSSAHYIS